MRMNIFTARDADEECLKQALREAATHPGAYGGYTLREHPHNMFAFAQVGCAPAHHFTVGVKGNTIWATDKGFLFVSGTLASRRIHSDWVERDFPDQDAARAAFRAAA